MSTKENVPATPCGTCPWRRENQTPDAVRSSPIGGDGTRWFDVANLRRHWRGVAKGQLMPCHATDKNAPRYGGKTPRGKVPARVCVGLSILAHREVTSYMHDGTDFKRYARRPGERMTVQGLAAWASRLYYAGCSFVVGRETLQMPHVEDRDDVCFPWPD